VQPPDHAVAPSHTTPVDLTARLAGSAPRSGRGNATAVNRELRRTTTLFIRRSNWPTPLRTSTTTHACHSDLEPDADGQRASTPLAPHTSRNLGRNGFLRRRVGRQRWLCKRYRNTSAKVKASSKAASFPTLANAARRCRKAATPSSSKSTSCRCSASSRARYGMTSPPASESDV